MSSTCGHTELCKDMSEVLVVLLDGSLKLLFQVMQSITDEFTALRQLGHLSTQILRHKHTPIKPCCSHTSLAAQVWCQYADNGCQCTYTAPQCVHFHLEDDIFIGSVIKIHGWKTDGS